MWQAYVRYTKEQWAAALERRGLTRAIAVPLCLAAWLAASCLWLAAGCVYLLAALVWLAVKYAAKALAGLFRLFFFRRRPLTVEEMDGRRFEEYVAELLRAEGWRSVEVTRTSGDFGADILAISPDGVRTCIQCKLYSAPVGVKAVQECIAALAYYDGDAAMVATNGTFTAAARELAEHAGVALWENIE